MTTEAEAIVRLAREAKAEGHIVTSDDGKEFLVIPPGHQQVEITPTHKLVTRHLDHIRQSVAVQTADSLVEYCSRYKERNTIIFADIGTDTIVCQVDYHEPQGEVGALTAHRATLTLSRSIEWSEWNRISGKLMEQLEFARFIEENGADVVAPAGAELLECVRDLQGHRKVNFIKAVRTSSENENFEWSDETETRSRKGGIEVPTKFQLGIPVYFGESDVEMFAFLRWRLDAPALHLGIQLHRPEHVRQAVFKGIVTAIAERTECMAVFGKI